MFSLTDNPELVYTYEKKEEAEQALGFARASDLITTPLTVELITEPQRNQGRYRIAEVLDQPERTWRNQFPESVAVPYQIEDFVKSGILVDTSWGNDAMPSFEFVGYENNEVVERMFHRGALNGPFTYRLWVDYPDANQREDMAEGLRFSIYRYTSQVELEEIPVFESNGIQETLDAITDRFFQGFVWVDRAIAMCPWSDCGGSDIGDRHDSGYHDSMRPEKGVRREELQCNDCGREWTLVIEGKDTRVVIDEGMRQIDPDSEADNAERDERDAVRMSFDPVPSPELAALLKARFPWLGTEEDAGSGADVIQELAELYNDLSGEAS